MKKINKGEIIAAERENANLGHWGRWVGPVTGDRLGHLRMTRMFGEKSTMEPLGSWASLKFSWHVSTVLESFQGSEPWGLQMAMWSEVTSVLPQTIKQRAAI